MLAFWPTLSSELRLAYPGRHGGTPQTRAVQSVLSTFLAELLTIDQSASCVGKSLYFDHAPLRVERVLSHKASLSKSEGGNSPPAVRRLRIHALLCPPTRRVARCAFGPRRSFCPCSLVEGRLGDRLLSVFTVAWLGSWVEYLA
jgi:hypothetical protein